MFRRRHYIALGVVLAVMLVILAMPAGTVARVKLALGNLFLPLLGLADSSRQVGREAEDALTPRSELVKQNEALRRENEQLKMQGRQAQEMAAENARLRQHFGWQPRQPWKLKLAQIVFRDPANWWRSAQIDLGSRDGLSNNLPVLATDGSLAGRISSVTAGRSQVLLLGDPNLKVSARLENPAHDMGIVGAGGPLETDLVEMSYLPRNAAVRPGIEVRTSGYGGIFPANISIGQVLDSRPSEYGQATVARVKLAANLNGLQEVWVLFP